MAEKRRYESVIIINASLEDNETEAVLGKIKKFIEDHGGEFENIDNWGRKRLAYPINKKFNGYYVHMIYLAAPDILPLFEKFLVLEDTVLRSLNLELSDELIEYRKQRELEKGKALRESEEASEKSDDSEEKEEKREKVTEQEES